MCGERKVQSYFRSVCIALVLGLFIAFGWIGMGLTEAAGLQTAPNQNRTEQATVASLGKPSKSARHSTRPVISTIQPSPDGCTPVSDCIVTVKGSWVEEALRRRLNLVILVRPLPDASNQAYWVQATPEIDKKGHWSSEVVYIGQPGDWAGMPFKLCVVATTETLRMGLQLDKPPAGPISCLDVKRGQP